MLHLRCLVHLQAQDEYERRLREEMEAKAAKEAEIEELVGFLDTSRSC